MLARNEGPHEHIERLCQALDLPAAQSRSIRLPGRGSATVQPPAAAMPIPTRTRPPMAA
jgi:hypothetical protein